MKTASVIIPARDRAILLPHVLDALARQSFAASKLEVVLVNDGSTDSTAAVVRDRRDPFRLVYIELESQPEFQPARPRNYGLRAASGELLIFLDADVVAYPDLVEEHVKAYAAADSQAVIGYTYAYAWEAEDRLPQAVHPPPPERFLDELPGLLQTAPERWQDGRERIYAATRDLEAHPAPWQMYWTNNVSVPRALALDVGGFDEDFRGRGVSDLEFAYRLYLRGVPIRLARKARGAHYPHPIPELADRWNQIQRNRRRLIRKHPGLPLELRLWNAARCEDACREVRAVLIAPDQPLAGPAGTIATVLDHLQTGFFRSGPVLFCGPTEPRLPGWQPAAWCSPGLHADGGTEQDRLGNRGGSPGADAGSGLATRPPECFPLLGLFTPWDDQAFAGAVVDEFWCRLPPDVQDGLVQEMIRVAGRVALLAVSDGSSESGRGDAAAAAPQVVAPAGLPPGYVWRRLQMAGVIALVAEPERSDPLGSDPGGSAGASSSLTETTPPRLARAL